MGKEKYQDKGLTPARNIVAAFDFDGTLTTRDSLLPFLTYSFGYRRVFFGLLVLLPKLIKFKVGALGRQQTKEAILTKFFQGLSHTAVQALAESFALNKLDSLIAAAALEKLQWHQRSGNRCIIVSASIETYLLPWARRHGIADVVASRFEVDKKGLLTGRLAGNNCWGAEKVRRLYALLGDRASYTLYAYGDSRGDQELLNYADYPFFCSFTECQQKP